MFPFDSIRSSEELGRRITQGPPDRPSDETTRRRLTDGWWTLCSLCWSQDPSKRPFIDKIIETIEDELFEARRGDRDKTQRGLMERR